MVPGVGQESATYRVTPKAKTGTPSESANTTSVAIDDTARRRPKVLSAGTLAASVVDSGFRIGGAGIGGGFST